MQYIPTLNYMCTRHNVALCERVIEACQQPISRRELGKLFIKEANSSTLSRLLFAMRDIGVLEQSDLRWAITARVKLNAARLPFTVVPVDGISANILRLFGSQYARSNPERGTGKQRVTKGPQASLTIKTLAVVLDISREVLQLKLSHLLAIGVLKRSIERRPYVYTLTIQDKTK